jgi:hypothetical protein
MVQLKQTEENKYDEFKETLLNAIKERETIKQTE